MSAHRKPPDSPLLLGRYRALASRRNDDGVTVGEAVDTEGSDAPVEVRRYPRSPGADAAGGWRWRRDVKALSGMPNLHVSALSAADADYVVLREEHPPARKPKRPTPSRPFVYTLEALVVVAVMALFHLAVADPLTGAAHDRAERQACIQARRELAAAIQMYHNDGGAYPRDLSVLVPHYVSALPACPRGGVFMGYPDDPLSWTCSRDGPLPGTHR